MAGATGINLRLRQRMMVYCVRRQNALIRQQAFERGDTIAQTGDLGDQSGDDGGQAIDRQDNCVWR